MKLLQYIGILGDVVPIGGTREGDRGRVPLVPGDSYVEPMSGFNVRVGGAYVADASVMPSSGGYQTLLDNNSLAIEARVLDALRHYHESVSGTDFD